MDPYEVVARYYDLEHRAFRDDIDFYLEVIDRGPILEVGSGTGRIMEPLLRSGLEVCGVDPSPGMVSLARRRLQGFAGADLHQTSIEQFASDRRFSTAILSLNVLWHLPTLAGQTEALRVARHYLDTSGRILIDLTNPLTMADRHAQGLVRERFRIMVSEGLTQGFSSAIDDEAAQTLEVNLWYDETASDGAVRRAQTQLQLRYIYRSELEVLLRLAGFSVLSFYGSYDLDPYQADSPSLIAIASGPPAGRR